MRQANSLEELGGVLQHVKGDQVGDMLEVFVRQMLRLSQSKVIDDDIEQLLGRHAKRCQQNMDQLTPRNIATIATCWGVLGCLPDINAAQELVAYLLRPNTLYLASDWDLLRVLRCLLSRGYPHGEHIQGLLQECSRRVCAMQKRNLELLLNLLARHGVADGGVLHNLEGHEHVLKSADHSTAVAIITAYGRRGLECPSPILQWTLPQVEPEACSDRQLFYLFQAFLKSRRSHLPDLNQFREKVMSRLGEFGGYYLSTFMSAFGNLNLMREGDFTQLMEAFSARWQQGERVPIQHVSMVLDVYGEHLVGMDKTGLYTRTLYSYEDLVNSMLDYVVNKVDVHFSPKDLSWLSHGLGRLRHYHGPILKYLCSEATEAVLWEMDGASMARFIWGLSVLNYRDDQLLERFGHVVGRKASSRYLDSKMGVGILRSLLILDYEVPDVLTKLVKVVRRDRSYHNDASTCTQVQQTFTLLQLKGHKVALPTWMADNIEDEQKVISSAIHYDLFDMLTRMNWQSQMEVKTPWGSRVDILLTDPTGKEVVIEVDGPDHYTRSRPYQEVGGTILRNKLLRLQGYPVIVVPWFKAQGPWSTRKQNVLDVIARIKSAFQAAECKGISGGASG